jgi:3'-phosphoadenosine 5'-phosphosulfate sulfotransferase (PAPS reductase)/FAD synthetase
MKTRHILGLSGGKDSTALAIFMRDKIPEMEYVFCDTDKELDETYEYLNRVEAFLGKKIVRLNAKAGFDHWLEVYGGYLPAPNMRWCTKMLKLKPFEEYVGDEAVVSYVGLRADEDRMGYISTKPNRIATVSKMGTPSLRLLFLLLPAADRMGATLGKPSRAF